MAKVTGPVPEAVKRRRNKDDLAPVPQGTRRGITVHKPQPSPHWRMDIRNYFNAVLASGAADWYENSDLLWLTLQCEMLDRVLRGSRLVPVYKTEMNDKGDWVPTVDEDGNPVPELDEFGEPEMRVIGSINGQALRSILDMGSELLVTEGSRRRLRIDLGIPNTEEEDEAAKIVAEQRKRVGKVTPIRKRTGSE